MKNDHEITKRNLLPGLQLIAFISIHVTLQIKYFMSGSQVRSIRQKGILVWAVEISSQLKHSCAGHKSYIAWLVSSLSPVCSTAALCCRRQDSVIWDQRQSVASGCGGPAVHFPSWTQTSVSSRLLAQENSNSWIQFRPLQSAATQKCNNVFFLVNIGLVFSIDDSEADFTVSWLRRSQTSLCHLIKVRLARLRPLTSS